jgi:50S ribosomal protein L16 3-hydroxylase
MKRATTVMAPTPIEAPCELLGGLSAAAFTRSYWQRRPLVVRSAWPEAALLVGRSELFALAARDDVESRLVARDGRRWTLRHGPVARRALPPLSRPGWTLLVQGLDLHVPAAHQLLARFRFVPDARLDDVMLSYASAGGGVGPHVDAYDVFLLQVAGCRRWRFAPCPKPALRDDVPLKMLVSMPARSHTALLEPGDLLYLPPGWAHEGTAVGGDCMTASVGFRAPSVGELARALLARLSDAVDASERAPAPRRYRDRRETATRHPAALPAPLRAFARRAVARALARPGAIDRVLGEWLSEPKSQVWFESGAALRAERGVELDRRTRMLYTREQIFINGESFRVAGRDAALCRRLADERRLSAADLRGLTPAAQAVIAEWAELGWLRIGPENDGHG